MGEYIMSKSKKKKRSLSLCPFHTICKYFYEDSYTCSHKGGDYCGKYRIYTGKIIISKIGFQEENQTKVEVITNQ